MSSPVDRLLGRLSTVRRVGPGRWMARCPSHDDGRASLSVREGDDGRVLVYCFAGCGAADVIAAAGLDWTDLFPESERRQTQPGDRIARRRYAPRIPASDALELIDFEAGAVLVAVNDILGGRPVAELADDLRLAVGRITAARAAWEAQP